MKVEIRNKPREVEKEHLSLIEKANKVLNTPYIITEGEKSREGVVYYNGDAVFVITEFYRKIKCTFLIKREHVQKAEPTAAILSLLELTKDATIIEDELEEFQKHVKEVVQIAKKVKDKL